jgi:hypothetical protein
MTIIHLRCEDEYVNECQESDFYVRFFLSMGDAPDARRIIINVKCTRIMRECDYMQMPALCVHHAAALTQIIVALTYLHALYQTHVRLTLQVHSLKLYIMPLTQLIKFLPSPRRISCKNAHLAEQADRVTVQDVRYEFGCEIWQTLEVGKLSQK